MKKKYSEELKRKYLLNFPVNEKERSIAYSIAQKEQKTISEMLRQVLREAAEQRGIITNEPSRI